MTVTVHEVVASIQANPNHRGQLLVEIISPGWGSSGYYSAEVLKNAVSDRVWPVGTHCYLDHPTETENYEQPARSVTKLVATLAEDARQDEQGRTVAALNVFGPYRDLITDPDFIEAVGMSIRTRAEGRQGEAEGRLGTVITRLVPDVTNSVDFVTHAGRGGRILQVLESLVPQALPVANPVELTESTYNYTRDALADALRSAYGGERYYVYVRDFDETTVWFLYETPDSSGTYSEGYELSSDGAITLQGNPVPVRAKVVYVPVEPGPGQPSEDAAGPFPVPVAQATTESIHPSTQTQETPNMATIQVEQAEYDRLQAAESRLRETEAALVNEQARAMAAENRLAANTVLNEALVASTTPVTFNVYESRGLAAQLPLTDEGTLDTAAYRTLVEDAIASKARANGAGVVTGFGETPDPAPTGSNDGAQLSVEALDRALGLIKE